MTVAPSIEAEIRRLFHGEHWPAGTIASQLGVHRDVVLRVLKLVMPPASSHPRPVLCDPYLAFIDETLAQYPNLRATRLFDMVAERGYTGSIRTLRKVIAPRRPTPKSEVYVRVETLPGEQSQIDWAHIADLDVPGGRRKLWAFALVLCHSRALYAELTFDCTAFGLRRSLLRAAQHFGGVTRQWLFDNPKVIVLDRAGDAIRFHPMLLDLCGDLHVQPRLCAVRRPQHKGKVERHIRYLRDRFFAGRIIHGRADNEALRVFCNGIALERRHPLFQDRTVRDLLDDERPRLLPLPEPLPALSIADPVSVDKTAFVRFDCNSYSVDVSFAHRGITLAADDDAIRLLSDGTEIAHHTRSYGKAQRIEDPTHRTSILLQRKAAGDAKGRDRLHLVAPQIDVLYKRWLDAGRNIGSMTAQAVRLLDLYTEPIFAASVADMVLRGTHDIGALQMLCDQRRRAAHLPMPTDIDLSPHVPERDVVAHDLGVFDAKPDRTR